MATFEIQRGTSKTLRVPLTDQDGLPLDVSMATQILLAVAADYETQPANLILSKTMTIVGGTTHTVLCALVPADTTLLALGHYVAEVHIAFADGTILKTPAFTFSVLRVVRR
jgi:hypothetical protein